SPSLTACSMSSVPTTRSSVALTGSSTSGTWRTYVSIEFLSLRSWHSSHQVAGRVGSQPNRQLATVGSSGSSAARARAAVDLAVPFSPRTNTPPILGLTAFKRRPSFIRSWPTNAVNGNMGRTGPGTGTSLHDPALYHD